jgi:hypothetical protein
MRTGKPPQNELHCEPVPWSRLGIGNRRRENFVVYMNPQFDNCHHRATSWWEEHQHHHGCDVEFSPPLILPRRMEIFEDVQQCVN